MGRRRHPETFTPAEQRVLEALRRGHTEIATDLGISLNTVKYHIANMLAKAGVADRHALAAYIPPPTPIGAPRRRISWAFLAFSGMAVGAALIIAIILLTQDEDEGTPPDGAFVQALRHVPYEQTATVYRRLDNGRTVLMYDYARAKATGPTPGPSEQEQAGGSSFLAQLVALMAHPELSPPGLEVWGARRQYLARQAENWLAAGIDPDRFQLLVDIGIGGPWYGANLAFGDWSVEDIEEGLASCAGCDVPVLEDDYRGQRLLSWIDPLMASPERAMQPPLFDHLGRAPIVAVTEGVLYRALEDGVLPAVLDAAAGRVRSLADDKDFVAVAREFDLAGAVAAFIADGGKPSPGAESGGQPSGIVLGAYRVGGAALVRDSAGMYLLLAFAHETEAAARQTAEQLPARVAEPDMLPEAGVAPTVTVDTRGTLVVAKVRGVRLSPGALASGPAVFTTVFRGEWP